jgi:hypothetical protein
MSFSVHRARPFLVLSKHFWRKRPTAEGYMGEVSHGLFCASGTSLVIGTQLP